MTQLWRLPLLLVARSLTACSGGGHDAEHGAVMGQEGGGVFASIPNPALIVANGGEGTVSIVDPTTLSVVSSVPVDSGLHPHHVSLAPDRSRALVTATSADLSLGHTAAGHSEGHTAGASTAVYQLDFESRELREVITVDATAHNATFTPDGALIALGMMEHGMIEGYDAASFALTLAAFDLSMPLEVTPTNTGALLIAESGAARVALFDLASQAVVVTFDVGEVPVAAWASGPNDYFVSVEEGMQVRHLVEDGAGIALDSHAIDPTGIPGQAVLAPSGQELWVAVEDRGVVAIFDAASHDKLAEFPAGTKPHGIAFEPDGARAFVTDEDNSRVLVIDVSARSVSSEIGVGAKPNGIAWVSR